MRCLSAGLIYVAVSVIVGLLLGMVGHGLNAVTSSIALMAGALAAVAAFFDFPPSDSPANEIKVPRYRNVWLWLLGFVFAIFAARSFGWLLYFDGETMRIQSPNNLGDLGLHITYINTFGNGTALWPDSPLYVFSKLRYPAGLDLFNGLLASIGIDLRHQLFVTGMLASAATFYAFYKWSGAFGIAGFFFNGGLVGFKFFQTYTFSDYQGAKNIAWKSIALSMFVTQRGLLYAIPAGLALLWHWRNKYSEDSDLQRRKLPAWVEYILYMTMPLFHVHTFIALSIVLLCLFACRPNARVPLIKLAAFAFLPATFFVYLVTDRMNARSVLEWHPGWTQTTGEFGMPFVPFWIINFGIFIPLAITLVIVVARIEWLRQAILSIDAVCLVAALAIFGIVYFVKTAPWEWDNTKMLIWSYFIILPLLWKYLIAKWKPVLQLACCFFLYFSGFVSLIGGLAAGRPGFDFANRGEIDFVAIAVRSLPLDARFAAFPTYNHPLLLNGRKLVLGYEGHLWTQGINYREVAAKLDGLMLGRGDWLATARELGVRYIFWGREEAANYGSSLRPWEGQSRLVAKGPWGGIYDLANDQPLTK